MRLKNSNAVTESIIKISFYLDLARDDINHPFSMGPVLPSDKN